MTERKRYSEPAADPLGRAGPDSDFDSELDSELDPAIDPAVDAEAEAEGGDLEVVAMTQRWREIQAGFVDEPQRAVEDADGLVTDLLDRTTQRLAEQCRQLESTWHNGERVSTEDLRVSMQGYRVLFERLLSV